MIGHIDGNNFYVSCERAFDLSLENRPVVVLSNNDKCIVSRSNEVKALGIKNGTPIGQIKHLIKQYDIKLFSSNYTLYGNMSSRMMAMLQSFVPEVEPYSIDEAFLDMSGFELFGLADYSLKITQAVTQATGIPVCMGVAPTKSLSKIADRFAKKYPKYQSVCIIDTEEKRIKALKLTKIDDVWGIGREYSKMLQANGCQTAFDFTQKSRAWVRKYMTVAGERIWRDLQGDPCINLELDIQNQKAVSVSRGFGDRTGDYNQISEALATYVSICGKKLRKQKSCASRMMVYLHTDNHKDIDLRYGCNTVIHLPVATNSTLELVKYALGGLQQIYCNGYLFSKVGVLLFDLVSDSAIQTDIFDTVDREKHRRIMKVADRLNNGFNTNLLTLAVQGTKNRKWELKQDNLSPCYTTRISDIIRVKI